MVSFAPVGDGVVRGIPTAFIVSIIILSYGLFFYFQIGSEFRLKQNVLDEAYLHQYEDNHQLALALQTRLNLISSALEAEGAKIQGTEVDARSHLAEKFANMPAVEGSSVLITLGSRVLDSWPAANNIKEFASGSDLSQYGFIERSDGPLTASSGAIGDENFIFLSYRSEDPDNTFVVAAIPVAGLLSGVETKPYESYFSEGNLAGITTQGADFLQKSESFADAIDRVKASTSEGLVQTTVYDDGSEEKILTAYPLNVGSQAYYLFVTSPVATHLVEIQEILFAQRIQTFSLLAGTSLVTIILALFVSKNLRLDREVRARTHELEESNALIGRQKRDLEQANTQLKQLDTLKDQFISVASHELKNPIQPILMYAELAKRGSISWEKAMDGISFEAKKLKKLAHDILDVSRIESGGVKCRIERVKLRPILEEIAAGASIRVPNGVQVDLVMEDPELELEVDRERIAQVIQNLMENSIKFTSRGLIKISVASDPVNNDVVLRISDTGTGIPEEILPTLFGKFVTKSVGERNTNGTGLGLYISRAIVNAHGGSISAANDRLGGAIFTISLPACNPLAPGNSGLGSITSQKTKIAHTGEVN